LMPPHLPELVKSAVLHYSSTKNWLGKNYLES